MGRDEEQIVAISVRIPSKSIVIQISAIICPFRPKVFALITGIQAGIV